MTLRCCTRLASATLCWGGYLLSIATAEQSVETIHELPFVATEPGIYRLATNLTFDAPTGSAIVIEANDVTIDLNGKHLRGTGGAATTTIGILAVDRQGLTIQHGTVGGFYFGVDIRSSDRDRLHSSRHAISNVTFQRNWYFGIRVVGAESSIVDCRILDTGGSSKPRHTIPHGVRLVGAGNVLRNCRVQDLRLARFADGKGEIVGAHFDAAKNGVCENNTFIELVNTADAVFEADDQRERRFGIWINGGPNKDTFLRVAGNSFSGFRVPVVFAPGSDGVVSNNTFIGADSKPIRGKPASQLPNNTTAAASD